MRDNVILCFFFLLNFCRVPDFSLRFGYFRELNSFAVPCTSMYLSPPPPPQVNLIFNVYFF